MAADDYKRIEQAIRYLDSNVTRQPDLKEMAAHVHLSEYHFQRLFRRWVGISPKKFLQFLTVDYARSMLRESRNVLDAALASGLSGPGRLHDMFIAVDAVTPGEFNGRGGALSIACGFHKTPFGEYLLAVTPRGICGLEFIAERDPETMLRELSTRWPTATILLDAACTLPIHEQILEAMHGVATGELKLLVQGTNFQIKVWNALLQIPPGALASYAGVAELIEQPQSARAVGHAVGQNAIAVLIPCHRVIRSVGAVSGYRWGAARKRALIGWEAAQLLPAT